VAAIGNPARFFLHLEALGITAASKHVFADHHAYNKTDFAVIDADIILMTEKDAVKCAGLAGVNAWYLKITARLPAAVTDAVVALARR
jgi:tetraacyldisaccharide 4'-kinase